MSIDEPDLDCRLPPLAGTSLHDDDARPDPGRWIERARRAEDAGLDFVVVEPLPADAALVAALIAARTSRIGIFVRIRTATTEPFHVSTQLATIDFVSGGRAGWLLDPRPEQGQSTVTWDAPEDPIADAREHVEIVRALWDSWEEGAEIRDVDSARFLDRDRVHHVDFRGQHISVRGPSITPRPPQGHPVILAESETPDLGADVVLGVDAVLVDEDDASGQGSTGTLRERFGLPAATNRYAANA